MSEGCSQRACGQGRIPGSQSEGDESVVELASCRPSPDPDPDPDPDLRCGSDVQVVGQRLVPTPDGKYDDKVQRSVQDTSFWGRIEVFINCTKSALYLLRLVDGQTPVLGKFYYCCALVDKHLRLLKETDAVPYINLMRSIFMKRWKHRAIHTFAYVLDPCYQAHDFSSEEKADCVKVCVLLPRTTCPPIHLP